MGGRYVKSGIDEQVAQFVMKLNPGMTMGETPFTAMGQLDATGNLVGGVVFNNYTTRDIHMHVAGVGSHWLNRRFIGEVFRYIFHQLGCRRCTGLVARSNEHAQQFDLKLGFMYEGVLRAHLPNDEDAFIFGMLREECRWLKVGALRNERIGKTLGGSQARAISDAGERFRERKSRPASIAPLRTRH